MNFDSIAKGRALQERLECSRLKAIVRSAAEEEEEKAFHLLGGILSKLQAFCEKTRNAHKKLKEGGVTSVVAAFKQVKAARDRRLTAQVIKSRANVAVQVVTTPVMVAERPVCRDTGTDTPW